MNIDQLSASLKLAMQADPDMHIEAKGGNVKVFLWFDAATGRELVLGSAATFSDAYADAIARREKKLAEAVVEAEVRAEVQARLAA
jgi:hypothetical protein